MSIQYGRWNFEGTWADSLQIDRVSQLVANYGLDDQSDYADSHATILFWPFHTTKESQIDRQPYVSAKGSVIAWDGRLDNQAELLSLLSEAGPTYSSDVSIVAAAYDRFGVELFAKLIGDWAVSIWDRGQRALILAVDPIGIRHLYYSLEYSQVTWSSILDPLVVIPQRRFSLNKEYIAGWLSFFPAADETPYIGIKAVPPACFLRVKNGSGVISRYWDFDATTNLRYKTDGEYEEHFRSLFAQSVRRRLRSNSPILAELSGGIDSSAIVCMADRVREQTQEPIDISTLSYFDDAEPNWNERPFVTIVEQHRGRTGCHIDCGSQQILSFDFGSAQFAITPGSMEGSPEVRREFSACLDSLGARVLLSGIGGDEVTGGIPNPLPELADYLVRGRLLSLARMLRIWALNKRKPCLHLLLDTVQQFLSLNINVGPTQRQPPWLDADFVRHHSDAVVAPKHRLRVSGALPSFQDSLQTIEGLRRQLASVAVMSRSKCDLRYPYLDRDLLEFLVAIPPTQRLRPGQRRSLMRRALIGIVPDEILNRRQKGSLSRAPTLAVAAAAESFLQQLNGTLLASLGILNSKKFYYSLKQIRADSTLPVLQLVRTIGLEIWLKQMVRAGFLCTEGSR